MSGRQWLGLALAAAGAALLAIGLLRLAAPNGSPGPGVSATGSAGPSGSVAPPASGIETPGATATATPVPPAPTPVPPLGESDVRDFVAVLVTAIQTGDLETLFADLHPAVIDRYGEAACRSRLPAFTDPTFQIEVLEVQEQAAWDYLTDELTTTIPDAWAVPGNRSQQGVTVPFTFHFAPWDGTVRWFTDCTAPL